MNHVIFRMAALILFVLGIGAGQVRADKTPLEEQLKQELSIQLEEVTITEALEQIGQKADLKIELSPEAVWKLPEGQDTRLSVTLEGRLSESLDRMLSNFFLRYAVGRESLTIYPRPELKHIIGRPTAQELRLLTNIYTNKMGISLATEDRNVSEGFVQAAFNGLAGEAVVIMPPDELRVVGSVMQKMAYKTSSSSTVVHDANSPRSTPITLALLLEGVERFYDGQKTWYIQGPEFSRQVLEIRIVPREEFWQTHLDQILDVSFIDKTGEAIVESLAARADLAIQFRGGYVPKGLARKVTIEVQNAKLIDVLDMAISVLGVLRRLNLSTGELELYQPPMPANESSPQTPNEAPADVGYVGKISIPMEGGKYFIEFMLRESDLTEELRLLRQQKLSEILEQLSKAAREQSQ